nr:MAG TPA: hypothetical protein [Caudoviricetes sp.]
MDNLNGYKAFEPGMICKGKQYQENTDYEEEGGEICEKGMMHYCVNPFDVLNFYPLVNDSGKVSDFATVKSLEEPVSGDNGKFATKKLHIGVKLGLPGFVKACIDYLKEETIGNAPNSTVSSGNSAKIGSSGDSAQISSSGDSAQISSSGYYAKIGSSGYYAKIGSSGDSAQIGSSGNSAKIGSSGDSAKIGSSGNSAKIGSSGDSAKIGSSGYYAQISSSGNSAKIGSSGYYAKIGSSGDSAQISSSGNSARIGSSGYSAKIGSSGYSAQIESAGEDSVICCAGHDSAVKAKAGSWITLAEWEYSEGKHGCVPKFVKTEYVDGERIKADTWYKLIDGEFTEVSP